eukprot:CAMPEP_0206376962 /NCGR_PEP_ID=MMETSP0294-20121207/9850_1 /ASSEMBLY_ACC=CAM_ASM_000327 /TAXON_ID=39354 /ORGANISM="Heterosigma akashiwo, Strain CCMP2393" /LENGTH=56 /DNA_ID=CAMNT_0053825299 /DNA_START=24 /DNA_END=194 /DNA_ORIENTATION=+
MAQIGPESALPTGVTSAFIPVAAAALIVAHTAHWSIGSIRAMLISDAIFPRLERLP